MLRVVIPVIGEPPMFKGLDYLEFSCSEGKHARVVQAQSHGTMDARQQAIILQIQYLVSREVLHNAGSRCSWAMDSVCATCVGAAAVAAAAAVVVSMVTFQGYGQIVKPKRGR